MNTITIFIIFIPILVVILLIANLLLAVHQPDSEKVTPYECGFSVIFGQTRSPFHISFFLVRNSIYNLWCWSTSSCTFCFMYV